MFNIFIGILIVYSIIAYVIMFYIGKEMREKPTGYTVMLLFSPITFLIALCFAIFKKLSDKK